MSEVRIQVKGSQSTGKSQPMVTELVTEGKFYIEAPHYCYEYKESELSGMEGTTTKLIFDGNKKLILKRTGSSLSSVLEFIEGSRYKGVYITEYGSFNINIKTFAVSCQIEEDGTGTIFLDYSMVFGNDKESRNKLEIKIS
jgi:uncharacterized beta-barrel protein YwiB (DUF1934 family)